jgi:hypothetical protein
MNQKIKIRLRDFMISDDGWGNDAGRALCGELLNFVERHPECQVFEVSLESVNRTDASFPRESVAELARRFRKQLGFYLTDVENVDLLDNWDAAALKKEQPFFVWSGKGYSLIGPQPSSTSRVLIEYVVSRYETRTSDVVSDLNIKVNNASMKLKQLWEMGFILRREDAAETGGIEFVYYPIR